MDPRNPGQPSRLPLSVSTRSMARLASSTSSNLTRPTLSSARKASTTLRRPAQAIAAPSRKRVVLGETSLNPRPISVARSPGMASARVGSKRKTTDEGSFNKKVRLHSPARLPPGDRQSKLKYPTTPLRSAGPTTPRRYGGPITPRSNGRGWVHPLAHTPNRVHTPLSEGNSVSSDEMILGDSPVGRAESGEKKMQSMQENQIVHTVSAVNQRQEREVREEWEDEDMEMEQEQDGSSLAAMEDPLDRKQAANPQTRLMIPSARSTTPPSLPAFKLPTASPRTTSPQDSPPPQLARRLLAIKQLEFQPTSRLSTGPGLAPPASPFTIAPSPRRGLSSISRFGISRQTSTLPARTIQSTLPFLPQNKDAKPSADTVQPQRTGLSSGGGQAFSASANFPGADDVDMDPVDSLRKPPPAHAAMLPPSRIPVRSSKPLPSRSSIPSSSVTNPINEFPHRSPVQASQLKRSALGNLGVAANRPGRPNESASDTASTSENATSSATPSTAIQRKPSYPSSLGSGPQARPRDRQISVPVPSHVIEPILCDVPDTSDIHRSPGLRSVSAPVRREHAGNERVSLGLSTRREGWMDTSRSLHGLSEALERLKVKKEVVVEPTKRPSLSYSNARMSLSSVSGSAEEGKENVVAPIAPTPASLSTSSRLSAVHRSRYSMLGHGVSGATAVGEDADGDVSMKDDAGDKSLAAIMCSNSGEGCFKGVVAFVDVRTADGSDSSGIFAEMLRRLGARVVSRPTDSCTHIIYKSGKPTTLAWYRKQEEADRPHIVGLSWVTRSKEAGKRLEEAKFRVEVGEEDIFAKRKSMEPKSLSLAAMSSSVSGRASLSIQSGVAEAKRKSLMHAPKVGSPLKKGYKRSSDSDDDDF